MSIGRRMQFASVIGLSIWLIALIGYCASLAGLTALHDPFAILAFWPLAILSLFSAVQLPWPAPWIISLGGWMALAVLVASVYHFLRPGGASS